MGTNITYEQYCTLLLSAAQAYVNQHTTKTNSHGTRHSVYNSEIHTNIPTEHDLDASIT